jgi:DNA-binding CsgD family transcriptional regulator
MNHPAAARIGEHAGLVIRSGRLRARTRRHDASLRETIAWAHSQLQEHLPPTTASRQTRAVVLGEDDSGAPLFCWVIIEDGKALVTFDDAETLTRRIGAAGEIYGLSRAQARLARILADGGNLARAAELMGVSINTVRTHLQRMFDRTGARNQVALIRMLLMAEAPKD